MSRIKMFKTDDKPHGREQGPDSKKKECPREWGNFSTKWCLLESLL